jgi:hypothetical protein
VDRVWPESRGYDAKWVEQFITDLIHFKSRPDALGSALPRQRDDGSLSGFGVGGDALPLARVYRLLSSVSTWSGDPQSAPFGRKSMGSAQRWRHRRRHG